jgi:MFS family permease
VTKRHLRTYGLYFLAWTAVGLFFFTQSLTQKLFSHDPTPWWHYLVSWLVGVYTSAFLTPVILWLGRRFPIERRNWPRRIALHLLLSIAFSFTQLAWESAILPYLGVFPAYMKGFVGTFFVVFMLGFHGNITTYFTLLGMQYGWRYYRKYQEREREALRLEFQALTGLGAILGPAVGAFHGGDNAGEFLALARIGGRGQIEREFQKFDLAGEIIGQLELIEAC